MGRRWCTRSWRAIRFRATPAASSSSPAPISATRTRTRRRGSASRAPELLDQRRDFLRVRARRIDLEAAAEAFLHVVGVRLLLFRGALDRGQRLVGLAQQVVDLDLARRDVERLLVVVLRRL